jgi:hypothetical protein
MHLPDLQNTCHRVLEEAGIAAICKSGVSSHFDFSSNSAFIVVKMARILRVCSY